MNIDKYYYFISSTNKTIFLSSDDNKTHARSVALLKLQPNINNLIGKKIIIIKTKSVKKEYYNNNKLSLIGGPIKLEIKQEIIKSSFKISSIKDNNPVIVYLSEKYVKNNKLDMKDIVSKYVNEKLNKGLLSSNVL